MTDNPKIELKILINFTIIIFFALIYSIMRYNVFGNVPISDIPTYVLNKSIAFSMILILPMIFYYHRKQKQPDLNFFKKSLRILAAIHVLLTIGLLSQNYYSKLFIDNKLTLFGNLAVLFGILTFVYTVFNKYEFSNLLIYMLIALHLVFIGIKGWFDVTKWNGYMPPITIICFTIILVLILLSLVKYCKGDSKLNTHVANSGNIKD